MILWKKICIPCLGRKQTIFCYTFASIEHTFLQSDIQTILHKQLFGTTDNFGELTARHNRGTRPLAMAMSLQLRLKQILPTLKLSFTKFEKYSDAMLRSILSRWMHSKLSEENKFRIFSFGMMSLHRQLRMMVPMVRGQLHLNSSMPCLLTSLHRWEESGKMRRNVVVVPTLLLQLWTEQRLAPWLCHMRTPRLQELQNSVQLA